ncbi:PREDICTED: substance-K receptor-like isoform X1 [Papilio xuthus]|uniref:Substance-K receptor-like isoform X1 n=2 Tax=Papilio xuthus TaxID=66420 RepID=A0AAJ7EHR5_PAPXU|nr:PREDICTED: substance-K receptor-like isoform X1 [Papilio xuthus]
MKNKEQLLLSTIIFLTTSSNKEFNMMETSTTSAGQDDDSDWSRNMSMEEYLNQNGTKDTYDTLYDVPTGLIVLLSVLYGSISMLAVVGNFLVMWVVATSRRMQSVTNCYIANLALADIVIGLFAIPFQFQAALLQRWLLPHFMCAFCPFVQALSVNVSVFTLTAIAVDRHRAIITPLSAHTSKRIAKVIIVFIWVLALSLAAPMAMSWEVIMEQEIDPVTGLMYKKPFCTASEFGSHSLAIYRLLLYVFQYVIPLCVITFAYAHMAMKLWGARAPGNAQETRDANQMKNKKRVIKMLVLVVALFALCWLPLQSYMLLQSFFPSINEYRYINVIFFCFDWLAMSNSCYNPFIYAIYNEKFKKEFKQRFTLRKKRNRFHNDSYEDGQSYRTRVISFRSTNERSSYYARKSISFAPTDAVKSQTRNSCHCARNSNINLEVESRQNIATDQNYRNGTNKNGFKTDTSIKRNKSKRVIKDDTLPVGDERVSELYIFPNSNVVEFTDALCDNRV